MKRQEMLRRLCRGGLIAGIYVILTMASHVTGLDSGLLPFGLQCRFSEALCVLPLVFPEAVAGLTVGCLLSNLLVGGLWQDVIFGTLATLLGALGTAAMRRFPRWHAFWWLPPVLSNSLILPLILKYCYGLGHSFWLFVATTAVGELLSATLLGSLLYTRLKKSAGSSGR